MNCIATMVKESETPSAPNQAFQPTSPLPELWFLRRGCAMRRCRGCTWLLSR